MHTQLLGDVKVSRISNVVAAGTGDTQTSGAIDMQGWDGVVILTAIGAIVSTGTADVIVTQCDTVDGTYADLAGSKISFTDADDNKLAAHDIYRPLERYLKVDVDRATANVTIDGMIAIQYRGRKMPVTQGTTVKAAKSLASPAEGTA